MDKVWAIYPAGAAHELDLISGKWTDLSTRFGKGCSRQIRKERKLGKYAN